MPFKATVDNPSFIDADRLYTLQQFIRDSGIGPSRIRAAARRGLPIPVFEIGKRKFIEGEAAVRYLKAMSSLHAEWKREQKQAAEIKQ